jgi:hypothetical protein
VPSAAAAGSEWTVTVTFPSGPLGGILQASTAVRLQGANEAGGPKSD